MSRQVLFLLPSVPDPPDSGAKLRNLMLLRLAARSGTVDAIAFGEHAEAGRLAALAKRCAVITPTARSVLARMKTLGSSGLPDMAERLWSEEFADQVRCMASECDVVQAEGIEMARYLSLVAPSQRVYDAHNAEFLLQRYLAEAAPNVPASLYSRLQWRRLERFERTVVSQSALAFAVSEHDANQLRALAPGADVRVVPNGIDVAAYPFAPPAANAPPNMLFLGKLDYRPNAQAAAWLVHEVLPALFEKAPTARLFVVGANPPAWLVRAGQHDPRLAVIGHVEDERLYLARCAALVLPVGVGGGSRLKALVAMASGVPIVSTGVGMHGLEAVAGLHYLQADRVTEWVEALTQVLTDTALRTELAQRGRQLVEECYDWNAIAPKLASAYHQLEA